MSVVELNYKALGQGPALIVLHGLLGSLDNWLTLGRRFAESRTVYLVDQRNHGRSPHQPEHSYALMAEDLLAFMDSHGIRSASLLGHSMGGKTAMRFALDHPVLVEKLVVADMGIKAYKPGHEAIFKALFDFPLNEISDRGDAEEWMSARIADTAVRRFLLKNLVRNKDGGFHWKVNLDALWNSYSDIIDSVEWDHDFDHPTLFIRGGASPYVPEEDWPAIMEVFPQAQLVTLDGAGHWLHSEQPDAFYDAVDGFLGA